MKDVAKYPVAKLHARIRTLKHIKRTSIFFLLNSILKIILLIIYQLSGCVVCGAILYDFSNYE